MANVKSGAPGQLICAGESTPVLRICALDRCTIGASVETWLFTGVIFTADHDASPEKKVKLVAVKSAKRYMGYLSGGELNPGLERDKLAY